MEGTGDGTIGLVFEVDEYMARESYGACITTHCLAGGSP